MYYFKKSNVNKNVYLQVWKKEKCVSSYVGTIGTPEKAALILVQLKYFREQTKELRENKTKMLKENQILMTKIADLEKKVGY